MTFIPPRSSQRSKSFISQNHLLCSNDLAVACNELPSHNDPFPLLSWWLHLFFFSPSLCLLYIFKWLVFHFPHGCTRPRWWMMFVQGGQSSVTRSDAESSLIVYFQDRTRFDLLVLTQQSGPQMCPAFIGHSPKHSSCHLATVSTRNCFEVLRPLALTVELVPAELSWMLFSSAGHFANKRRVFINNWTSFPDRL